MRGVLLAALLWCSYAEASAQGWRIEQEGGRVALVVDPGAPIPEADAVLDQLSQMLNWPRAATAPVRAGEVFASGQSRAPKTGRLRNDVYRAGLTGERILLLPRGAPVFQTGFEYLVTSASAGNTLHHLSWAMWCGPAPRENTQDAAGYCFRQTRGRTEVSRVPLGRSVLLASITQSFVPSTDLDVDEADETAVDELPTLDYALVLERAQPRRFRVAVVTRAEGEEIRRVLDAPRDSAGVGIVDLGDLQFRLAPAGEAFQATMIAPDTGQLRTLAGLLVDDARAWRAAGDD